MTVTPSPTDYATDATLSFVSFDNTNDTFYFNLNTAVGEDITITYASVTTYSDGSTCTNAAGGSYILATVTWLQGEAGTKSVAGLGVTNTYSHAKDNSMTINHGSTNGDVKSNGQSWVTQDGQSTVTVSINTACIPAPSPTPTVTPTRTATISLTPTTTPTVSLTPTPSPTDYKDNVTLTYTSYDRGTGRFTWTLSDPVAETLSVSGSYATVWVGGTDTDLCNCLGGDNTQPGQGAGGAITWTPGQSGAKFVNGDTVGTGCSVGTSYGYQKVNQVEVNGVSYVNGSTFVVANNSTVTVVINTACNIPPTPTPTISRTPSITTTPTISVTKTITPTISITPTRTPTITLTKSLTPTISITPTRTPTISITSTPPAPPTVYVYAKYNNGAADLYYTIDSTTTFIQSLSTSCNLVATLTPAANKTIDFTTDSAGAGNQRLQANVGFGAGCPTTGGNECVVSFLPEPGANYIYITADGNIIC